MERKQKKTKGIILALLVGVSLFLLIGVAAVLYGKLSSGYETDRLAVYEESEGSKKEEDITGETEEEKVEDTTEETEKVEDTMEETEKEKVEDRENSTEETTSSSKETTSENQQETQEDKAPDFEVYDKDLLYYFLRRLGNSNFHKNYHVY